MTTCKKCLEQRAKVIAKFKTATKIMRRKSRTRQGAK